MSLYTFHQTKLNKIFKFGIAVFTVLFISWSHTFSQGKNFNEIKPFQKYVAKDTTDSIDPELLDKTIAHHEQIIAKYPNEPFIPNIMFELAESYASKSVFEFKKEMVEYDEQIKKFDKGEILVEPILPRISYKETIDICYKLFEKFPDIIFKDKILYRLAICHLDEGNHSKAKEYFQQLIFETPTSNKISESHFRLGEYYFAERDFRKAIEQYNYLLQAWNDPYFNMALYKLGWSYYNINDYSNAISTYIYLISDITLLETLNTDLLGKTKADVKTEAIEYIAHSLTEFGGPTTAKKLLNTEESASYAIDIFLRMGEIYKKRNFYPEAISTYETLLTLFPLYPEAPMIQKEVIQCYEENFEEEKAINAKETFVKKYGPNSQWISQYPEGKVRNDAITLTEEMLFSLGTYYQAKAQEKNRVREYKQAIEKYEDFLAKFRTSPIASKVNYYLAECYFNINEYDKAADEYFKVMTLYDQNEFKDVAAYNRILSYYQLLKTDQAADSVTFYLEDFLGEGELAVPVKVGSEYQANLLKACNDFVKYLPASENLLEVLMKYAESLYQLNKWDLAAKVYEKTVADQYKNSPYYGQALSMIAHCYFKLGDFKTSEQWFNNLAQAFPDSAKVIEKASKMVSSANYKIAEKLRDEGDNTKAAIKFLNIAFNTKDKEIARAAIFEAANQFEKSGEVDKAVKAFERMLEKQPNIEYKDELLIKTGLLYEKLENFIRATDNYLKLVNTCPQSKFAPRALLNAASCFEQMELWSKAKQTYVDYISKFAGDDADNYIESSFKLGELSLKMRDEKTALKEFNNTVLEYANLLKRNIAVDEYFPAKAQYMIAEINFQEYKQVQLVPPLDITLKKKKDLLNKVVKGYVAAQKFKVADWSTASLHKTGLTFEELAESFNKSPIPGNLTTDERENYTNLINKQVIFAKEKALECYKANVTSAEKNNVQNEWTLNSKQRMEQLIIELGLASKATNSENTTSSKIIQTSQIKGN